MNVFGTTSEQVLGDGATWCVVRARFAGCAEPVEVWCSAGALEHAGELVLPSSRVELVWNLGAPLRWRVGERLERVPALSLSSVCGDAFELRHPARHHALGLRMPPELAHRLFDGLRSAATPTLADARDLAPRGLIDELTAALGLDAPGLPEPRALAVRALGWLHRRCARAAPMPRRVRVALEALRAGRRVRAVADAVELSHAQLTRTFKDALGVTPRRFAQVVRLNEACRHIARGAALVDVAYACGFADQSHMTRSFAALAGVTPGTFAAAHYATATTVRL